MTDKKRYINQGSPEGAKLLLKQLIRRQIIDVYKTALETIEIRFGDNFEGFEPLRKKILDTGNNAIRRIEERIEHDYDISAVKHIITIMKKGNNNDG